MTDDIDMTNPEIVAAFEAMNWFRETYKLSHAGTVPGRGGEVVIYGLRHPETGLHYFDLPNNTFDPINRERWEELTDMHPPFPWNEDGTEIVYSTEEPWWTQRMIPDANDT